MMAKLQRTDWVRVARYAWAILLSLGIMALIVWTGVSVWRRPCRVSEVAPSTACPALLIDLEPAMVALCFWIIGIVVWRAGEKTLTLEFFLLTAGALTSGKLSALDSDWGARLFYLVLAWLPAIVFHFHLVLLGRPPRYVGRIVLAALYGLAIAFSVPSLLLTRDALLEQSWFVLLHTGVRLNLACGLVLTAMLLLKDYWFGPTSSSPRRIRLVGYGNLLAIAPLLFLSLLPDAFGTPVRVPYEVTFPWLLLSPLAYAYSLFRHQLTDLEASLSRGADLFLLVTVLVTLDLMALAVVTLFVPNLGKTWPLVSLLLSAGLLVLFVPLQRRLVPLTTWVWYGPDVASLSAAERISEALSLAMDRRDLRHLLVEELASALRLDRVALFLRGQENELALLDAVGCHELRVEDCRLTANGSLATCLGSKTGPMAANDLRSELAHSSLSDEERRFLAHEPSALYVPLVSTGVLQGLLLIGRSPGSDFFTAKDIRVLTSLARQAGVASHNVQLAEQLRASREELARAHQCLMAGHEKQRRQLAQELHDGATQQLLGISMELANIRQRHASHPSPGGSCDPDLSGALENAQQEIKRVVMQLRGLIRELRPPGLQELGLTEALRGYAACLEREASPNMPAIELDMDLEGRLLSEPVAICLFRVVQEAIRNALKHATASEIQVQLGSENGDAVLRVCDDGCGFHVPTRLSEFTHRNHYGLVGMAERVAWVNGHLNVYSEVGSGTQIIARVPMDGVGRC